MVEGHLVNKNTPEAGVCAGAGVMEGALHPFLSVLFFCVFKCF